jgi:hypothetical protein
MGKKIITQEKWDKLNQQAINLYRDANNDPRSALEIWTNLLSTRAKDVSLDYGRTQLLTNIARAKAKIKLMDSPDPGKEVEERFGNEDLVQLTPRKKVKPTEDSAYGADNLATLEMYRNNRALSEGQILKPRVPLNTLAPNELFPDLQKLLQDLNITQR